MRWKQQFAGREARVIETGGAVKKIKQGHYFCWHRTRAENLYAERQTRADQGHKSKRRRDKRRRRAQLQSTLLDGPLIWIYKQYLGNSRVRGACISAWVIAGAVAALHFPPIYSSRRRAGGRAFRSKCNWLCAYSGGAAHVGSVGDCAWVHSRASLPRSFDAAPSRRESRPPARQRVSAATDF